MTGRLVRFVLLSALALAAVLVGAASLPRAMPAQQVPSDHTRVVVRVGGDRTTGTPREIANLAGIHFGLFESQPTSFDARGFATGTPRFMCGPSANGDCVFNVPNTGTGETNRNDRLWLAPISGPPGWFNSPEFQTAPLSPTGTTGDSGRRPLGYVFQTPPL